MVAKLQYQLTWPSCWRDSNDRNSRASELDHVRDSKAFEYVNTTPFSHWSGGLRLCFMAPEAQLLLSLPNCAQWYYSDSWSQPQKEEFETCVRIGVPPPPFAWEWALKHLSMHHGPWECQKHFSSLLDGVSILARKLCSFFLRVDFARKNQLINWQH